MDTEHRVGSRIRFHLFVGIFLVLLVSTVSAKLFHMEKAAAILSVPLLVMAGWGFIGHLVSLDDDIPGGWSNPDGDVTLWRQSVRELLVKLVVVLGVLAVFFWSQSGP